MDFLGSFEYCLATVSQSLWGWPLIFTFIGIGAFATIALNFVQFRYFIASWKYVLMPGKAAETAQSGAVMSPLQAFINALGSSTGNGSIAGMATAVYAGGPGAAFWILVAGLVALVLRFCEVYLATYVIGKHTYGEAKGGPMVYLSLLPGGKILPYIFTVLMLFYGLASGNAMQVNAIGLGAYSTWAIAPIITACVLVAFIAYVMVGGAERILAISDKLVPFKVAFFFITFLIVLIYHYANIIPALQLIFASAFTPQALTGAAAGFTMQQAIRNGFARSLNANEAGLGSAGIFFGASGTKQPMRTSIMSMLSAFISTYLVCFVVALTVVASGVWDNGLCSIALTVSAFNTVFGTYGGWLVTFAAAMFGLGCLVSFSLVARESWKFLTNGRWIWLFNIIYCLVTFGGTLAKVDMIWNMNDVVNGLLLLINLYAIIWLMPAIRRGVVHFNKTGQE